MWSNHFLNEFPTYDTQYAIELLHSLGSKFDNCYCNNEILRNTMIDLAKKYNKCFYQVALRAYEQLQKNVSFDLSTIFNDETFHAVSNMPKKDNITKSCNVAVVYVTPTSARIMPLETIEGHRALRHEDFNGANDFCLVYLKPDPPKKYVQECDYFKTIFQSGIEICNNRYYAFGTSNSQLREYSYWFVRATSLEEAHDKRQRLGDFSAITNVGKYVARLGQWFSRSCPTEIKLIHIGDLEEFNVRVQQGDYCVTTISDIERNNYCFTDGNGLISRGLAKLIAVRLHYIVKDGQNEIYPSAYQIRTAGCKGLVIIDPESTEDQFYIKIRPSMKKFGCDQWDLEIVTKSYPIPHSLNNQIIMLLSDLGIPNFTFIELQDKWLQNKPKSLMNIEALRKNKLPLPMNECRYMFGCALQSKLEQGQCFIRYQVLDDDGKPLQTPEFRTVLGSVIITKNPCPYAGDIIKLQAVDMPELDCLRDVIVFSTNGDRPDCNKIAGSDLDGDQYFVYWGQQLQVSETIEPLEYNLPTSIVTSTSITAQDIINYWLSLLGATSYGEIYNLHAIIVDKNEEGHVRRTCQSLAVEMAIMFSAAIDAGKTGYKIDRDRIKEIRKLVGNVYPDFLMKKSSYPSQSILGILYRKTNAFITENQTFFGAHNDNNSTSTLTEHDKRNFRFYVKVRTTLKVNPNKIHEELCSVFGTKVPPKLIIQEWSEYYRKKCPIARTTTETITNEPIENSDEVYSFANDSPSSATNQSDTLDSDSTYSIDS